MSTTNDCRMYRAVFPATHDLVKCKVTDVNEDLGVYVQLLEYALHEALIPITELSRKRIKSMRKLIKVGDTLVAKVLRVDEDRGHIDLSKAKVQLEEIARFDLYYALGQRLHSVVRTVAERCQVPMCSVYEPFVWDLYPEACSSEDASVKYAALHRHPFERVSQLVHTPERLHPGWSDAVRTCFVEQVLARLKQTSLKLQCDIQLTCFSPHGIDGIISALKAGLLASTPDVTLSIRVLAAPQYILRTTVLAAKRQEALAVMTEACARIEARIAEFGGAYCLSQPPRVLNLDDEQQRLNLALRAYEQENDLLVEEDEDASRATEDE